MRKGFIIRGVAVQSIIYLSLVMGGGGLIAAAQTEAAAQSEASARAKTPREIVVRFLGGTLDTQTPPDLTPDVVPDVTPDITPEVVKTDPAENDTPEALEIESVDATGTEIEVAEPEGLEIESLEIEGPEPEAEALASLETPSLDAADPALTPALLPATDPAPDDINPDAPPAIRVLPFYTSAPDYLTHRGRDAETQLRLTYTVSTYNAKTAFPAGDRIITLIIGADYAALSRAKVGAKTAAGAGQMRIYDFRFNRILTLNTDTAYIDVDTNAEPIEFSHISLFPKVLRHIQAVKQATQNGARDTIALSPDMSLDALWMEAAMGYAARPAPASLTIEEAEDRLTANYDGKSVYKSVYSEIPMPSPGHRRSFTALLHHELSIHPAILQKQAARETIPTAFDIISYTPTLTDGVQEVWTLDNSETRLAPFPLPETARMATDTPATSPLAFVISKAASGEAVSGYPDAQSLERAIDTASQDNTPARAWLLAQRLDEVRERAPDSRTRTARQGVDEAASSGDIDRLKTAFGPTPTREQRITAIKSLRDVIDTMQSAETDIPAIAFRHLGMMRARIKPADAKAAGIADINPKTLLETAIAKDPYDPQSYRGLSQIFAARKAYVESWDLQDALRRLPLTRDPIMAPTERSEVAIMRQGPAFFVRNP